MSVDRNNDVGSWGILMLIGVQVFNCTCWAPSLYGNDDDAPAAQAGVAARIALPMDVRFRIDNIEISWVTATESIDSEGIDGDENGILEHIRISDEAFDRLLSHRDSIIVAASELMHRNLTARTANLDLNCGLTSEQKRKLFLAARGDVRRFQEKAGELRHKYQETLVDIRDVRAKLAVIRDLSRDLEALCRIGEDAYIRDDTLFAKTMRSCLSAEQKDVLLTSKVAPAIPLIRGGARFSRIVRIERVVE